MIKIIKSCLVVLLILSCNNYKEISNIKSHWVDIQIKDLNLPIHKMESTTNSIWATDYGDGFLYQSKNNGKTWAKIVQFKSEYVEAIQFVDDANGFVCGDYGYVYKTTNDGKSWQEISPKIKDRIIERYRGDSTKNQRPEGVFSAYYQMYFLNKNEGFVSGFSFEPKIGRKSYHTLLFHTFNGGKTWKEIVKNEYGSFIDNFVKRASPSYKTINNSFYFNTNKSIRITRNKEKKQVVIISERKKADTIRLPEVHYKRSMLRNILFLNYKNGYIFGGSLDKDKKEAIIYETRNGGKTWKLINTPFPHIHATLLNGNYLWITGKKGMIKRKQIR